MHNSTIDFDNIYQNWRTKTIWIRFNTKDMRFYTVPNSQTIKQPSYSTHADIYDANIHCWGGVLADPKLMTVPFEETAWTVTSICARRIHKDQVSYLIDWKSANGRVFPR